MNNNDSKSRSRMRTRYAAHRTAQQHAAYRAYMHNVTRTVITSEIYFRPLTFATPVPADIRAYYRMRPSQVMR